MAIDQTKAILVPSLLELLASPGHCQIDIYYTGSGVYAAAISHQEPKQQMVSLGVLLKSKFEAYSNKNLDDLILSLHEDFKEFDNVVLKNVFLNKSATTEYAVLH